MNEVFVRVRVDGCVSESVCDRYSVYDLFGFGLILTYFLNLLVKGMVKYVLREWKSKENSFDVPCSIYLFTCLLSKSWVSKSSDFRSSEFRNFSDFRSSLTFEVLAFEVLALSKTTL